MKRVGEKEERLRKKESRELTRSGIKMIAFSNKEQFWKDFCYVLHLGFYLPFKIEKYLPPEVSYKPLDSFKSLGNT